MPDDKVKLDWCWRNIRKSLGGAASISDSDRKTITQAGHGFVSKNVIYHTGGAWAKAKADSAANAESLGIVEDVSGDDFTIVFQGYLSNVVGLTADTLYFLSATTAGLLTATEPGTEGQVSKPILYADTTTSGIILMYRGTIIGSTQVKKELTLPIAGTGGGVSAPAFDNTFSPFDGWAFGIGDDLHYVFEVPVDCDTNEDMEICLHYFIDRKFADESAYTNWQAVYRIVKEDGTEAVDSGGSTATITSGAQQIAVAEKNMAEICLDPIIAANFEHDDIVGFDFTRIANDGAEPNPGGAPAKKPIVVQIEIEYTSNKLGEAI